MRISLAIALLAILSLPSAGTAQVNPRPRVNRATGELVEQHYADRYQNALRDRRRKERFEKSERLLERRVREAAYAEDACGLGCSDHEGIQVQGIPGTPLAAVLYKAQLEDGVLTLRLRFHNDGSKPARLVIDPTIAPETFFVLVGERKLFILEDEDGELQAKERLAVTLDPGEIESWWAKFPASGPGIGTIDLEIPPIPTFRDVPISEG